MKRYLIQTQRDGQWVDLYLCSTKEEALRKAQYWDGPVRVILCMR